MCAVAENKIVRPPSGNRLHISSFNSTVILESTSYLGIHNHYTFRRILGHGQYGTVREAAKKTGTGTILVAVKSISKKKLQGDLTVMKRELEVLCLVDHPNVIKLYETYEDAKYLHLVMELCTGGDLFDHFFLSGSPSEHQVACLMRKLIIAVNYLHGLSICHRDVKPDNCLFVSKREDAELKLIDLGMARANVDEMNTMVGTPYYLAPEILRGHYGLECDTWSLGVVMFVLLSGRQPFQGENLADIFRRIRQGRYDFEKPEWRLISEEATSLISGMLQVCPSNRIPLDEALRHPWFSLASTHSSFIPLRVLTALKKYKAPSLLQQHAMKVVLQHLSSEDISDLNEAFLNLDREKTGFITAEDLETAMKGAGFDLASEEIHRIVSEIDYLHLGKIQYTDFLMATLDKRRYLDEEMLDLVFDHFDLNQDGFITISELKQAFLNLHTVLTDEEIAGVIGEFDLNSDRQIDFEEFKHMMQTINTTLTGTRNTTRRGTKQRTLNMIAQTCSEMKTE